MNLDAIFELDDSARLQHELESASGRDDYELRSVLNEAIRRGAFECVRMLVEQGIDPRRPDQRGKVPVVVAITNDRVSIVEYFIASSLLIPAEESELLFVANITVCLDVLATHGADLKVRDPYGSTLIHSAIWKKNNRQLISYLVANGVDINAVNSWGHTALMEVCSDVGPGDLCAFLIDKGSDIGGFRSKQLMTLALLNHLRTSAREDLVEMVMQRLGIENYPKRSKEPHGTQETIVPLEGDIDSVLTLLENHFTYGETFEDPFDGIIISVAT